MTVEQLAIVGGGPLCTYALERLAALLSHSDGPIALRVSVFDRTGRFGAGATHSDLQCATSYMNRVASQIAFAADESNSEASHLLPRAMRPTFFEWANAKYEATGDARFRLRPGDIPRRALHGEALLERFEHYVSALRLRGVAIDLRETEVTDIAPEGDAFLLYAAGWPAPMKVDRLLLVTGHSSNHPAPGSLAERLALHAQTHSPARYVAQAYPLTEQLTEAAVPPHSSVGVLGMGLTAIDVLLHLTEGRGGTFERRGDELHYVAGGREPAVMITAAPSGMFPSCRPENEKAADGSGAAHAMLEHKAVFLTIEAVQALRASCGVSRGDLRQIDFERHVFPLAILEMAYVYGRTLFGIDFGETLRAAVDARYRRFLEIGCAARDEGIALLLEPVSSLFAEQQHRFDWQSLFEPLGVPDPGDDWQERVKAFMHRDHAAAAEGNLRNPVKAACDGVWRDQRSVLSAAVDFGGLTAASQRRFAEIYLRYYTRLSNGIGLEPMTKVLALIEAGLVDVSLGPKPVVEPVPGRAAFQMRGTATGVRREVDVVVEGRAHPFDVERDVFPLYPNLFRRGLVRRWRNRGTHPEEDYEPGGLEVTRDLHPIRRDGTIDGRITILGAPIEGVAYFQLSAARPRSNSAVLNNVARWANELVEALSFGEPEAAFVAHETE